MVSNEEENNKTNYFGEREEQAVIDYLNAPTKEEKGEIYRKFLKVPFTKMISSIIRRYKLHRKGYSFEEVFNDAESFLATKMDMYDPTRNTKAYSYYGTTCRNYLTGLLTKDGKEKIKRSYYEELPTPIDMHPNVVHLDEEYVEIEHEIIRKLIKGIDDLSETDLTINEKKVAYALKEIFKNYEDLFLTSVKNNDKFNKSLILLTIKDLTNLNLKEIRTSMVKFKLLHKTIIKSTMQGI